MEENEIEVQEEEPKKKGKFTPLLLIPVAIIVAAAVIVVLFILPRLKGEAEEPPPEEEEVVVYDLPTEFTVGEETVAAMELAHPAGVDAEKALTVTYTYTGLTDTPAEVSAYVTRLNGAGFQVVDEEFVTTDTPDLTAAEGTVLLAKNLATPEVEEGEETPPAMVLTMRLTWMEDICVVVGDQAEGRVTRPPASSTTGGAGGVTISEAEGYIRGLSPASLGLEGESMENYRIYAVDGTALVDGQPCMRIAVYNANNPEHTNDFVAYFLLAGDGTTVYKVDSETGKAVKLDLP